MDFVYTRHQVPRGSRPDAELNNELYLIKHVSELRLTYQIRMLTYQAESRHKKLIIRLPAASKIHSSLRDFVRKFPKLLKIERT